MANITECLYEILQVCGDTVACLIPPQTKAAGTTVTTTIDMSGYGRALFVVLGGAANDAAAQLTLSVLQCTTANDVGGDAKALAGKRLAKAIATVTSGAGFATLNQLWLIEVRAEEMDVNNGFAFLELQTIVSIGDTWLLAAVALRESAAYEPVDNALVTTIED